MDVKTIVWIKSGGRCAICNRYLLDNDYGAVVPIGENAHIVGRLKTDRSPRGDDSLPVEQRDKEGNLVLLCREQHRIVDNRELVNLFTVEELRRIKKSHEERIRRVTGMKEDRKTTVLRVIGEVRGYVATITRSMAAAATIASSGRYPHYARSAFGDGVEVDFRNIPGEGTSSYYDMVKKMIDQETKKLDEAIRADDIFHVSVFAFARLPVLMYLGHKLNDTYPVDVYQRHRNPESWTWNPEMPEVHYTYTEVCSGSKDAEVALIVNVSGTVPVSEVQQTINGIPIYQLAPTEGIPYPDGVTNPATLKNFEATLRLFLAELEQKERRVQRLHIFTAVPLSVGVVIGRVFNFDVDPTLVIYELVDGQRVSTMEISR
jgi:hypothetical protein